jgi:hypothetical protein
MISTNILNKITLTGQAYEDNNAKLPYIMSKVSPKKRENENFNERWHEQ